LGRQIRCLDDPALPALLVAEEPVVQQLVDVEPVVHRGAVEPPVVQLLSEQSRQITVDFASVKSNFIKLMTQHCLKTT